MENKEEKVLYKGEEMSPQEFVERMEIDTKKKERNAESIARQKLEKKQEEAERRKAFAASIVPTEEDKIEEDYGPGSDQQEEPTDMSMYQVNMPFDIQQAPVQQFQSLEIPQVQEARLGGLMSLMNDSKIDSFKKGGMKTSKSKDGTVTNTFRNKDGNTVVQVKNKDGKYYEKVIRPEDTRKTLGALQQAVSPEFKALSYQDPTLEERVNYNLGNPQRKARNIAHHHAEEGEDDIDNIRHPFAGRYTAEALYKMRKKDTPWAPDWMNKGAAWLDANMLGVAHEAGTILRDERPWNIKLREAAEDIYNNGAGINVGLSDRTARQKTDYLLDKAYNFELPDGRGEERPFRNAWTDPYDKKRDGGKKKNEGKKSEYEESFPINTSGPRNENQSTIYSEDIKKEDLPLSASPSYRAYTMAKVGGYDEVTNRMGMGSHDIRENLIIKSDPESSYNYFLNPETGKEFEPLDYEGSKSDNLQRFLINVNRGEGQTKDFYSKTDKNGNLIEGSIPKFINTDEDTKQNIFKDLYIQNLAKYKNKDRAYYKSVNTMQNIIEPQLNSISYTGDDTDKYAFNKDNNRSMSQVKDIYWQKASDEVIKDLVKKYGSVSQARDKVSSEELNKLIENSDYYKNKTKDLEKNYNDYEKNKNLIKNAKFSNGGLFSKLMDDNNISTYKKSKKK